ncbi:MAG: aldo/keto reductase [Actinomycetaceae bacterium]
MTDAPQPTTPCTTIEMAPGLTVSRVAHGFWRWDDWGLTIDQLRSLIDEVIELGITTFDHADGYSGGRAETAFGEAIGGRSSLRESMQIITKSTLVYPDDSVRIKYYDTSEKHIIERAEQSLRKMKTDYIDLLLLHRPDPLMDPESTASAFDKLHAAGKVRHFGVSNYKASEFDMLASYSNQPLVTNQIEASVLAHENFDDRTVQHAQTHRIHPMVWSPLAGGRIFFGEDEAAVRVRAELEKVREEIGAESIDDVAFAWLYTHPVGFLPITGASEIEYIRRPVDALKHRLTKEQWYAIWIAQTGHKVP